jgi:nucleoside-diphosphate-sugar epimerase
MERARPSGLGSRAPARLVACSAGLLARFAKHAVLSRRSATGASAAELTALGASPGRTKLSTPLTAASGKVCVTGASGFIAMHLVSQLLAKNYEVVATVRSEAKAAQVKALGDRYPGKLKVVGGCDLLTAGSFDAAVAGCVAVYHTASPFYVAQDKGAGVSAAGFGELVLPAVLGTRTVLESCKLAGTVKRVVVTASFACILNTSFAPDVTYHDGVWNVGSFPNANREWTQAGAGMHAYRYSKIMAEKTAWDFAAQPDTPFDVVTINPPLVIGQNLDTADTPEKLNESSLLVYKWLTSKPTLGPNGMGFVDVADVARAHIVGMEAVAAGGNRYLTSAPTLLWADAVATLREACPQNPNLAVAAAEDPKKAWTMDTSRIQALGMTFTPAREALKKQIASVIEQFPEVAVGLEPKAAGASWDNVPLEGKKSGGGGMLRKIGLPVVLLAALAWLWRFYQRSKKALPAAAAAAAP